MSLSRRLMGSESPFSSQFPISGNPTVHSFFEKETCTWQYVVGDPATRTAVIIDPVLDYDASTQGIATHTADSILAMIKKRGYVVDMILETHIHADHLSAASYLQRWLSQNEGYQPRIGIGKRIGKVQRIFGRRYGISPKAYHDAFEKLFEDDEPFSIGELSAKAIHLPGHTPDHIGYQIGGQCNYPGV